MNCPIAYHDIKKTTHIDANNNILIKHVHLPLQGCVEANTSGVHDGAPKTSEYSEEMGGLHNQWTRKILTSLK